MLDSHCSVLSTGELARMDKTELAAALREREEAVRRLHAEQAAVLAEIDNRGVHATFGYGSLETLQVDLLRVSRREAKRRTVRARALNPATSVTGAQLPASAPHTAAAHAAGWVGVEHVDEIVKTLTAIPATVPVDQHELVEKTLVELASRATPLEVRKAGIHAISVLDPDGEAPSDKGLDQPERELHLGWRRDGRLGFTGILDAETGVLFETLLSPLCKPRPADDGERDPRGPEQRRGDGFADLLERVHRSLQMPTEAGERPTVVVTMTLQDLMVPGRTRIKDGHPVLNDGTPITVEQARRIACDAALIPAVLGGRSETLDLGRAQRTATPAQRRMLNLRDGGCVKCRRPARWCQAHHLVEWQHDGKSDIANMCLLCPECHRLIHHSDWRVVMNPDGKPECIPPPWLGRRC